MPLMDGVRDLKDRFVRRAAKTARGLVRVRSDLWMLRESILVGFGLVVSIGTPALKPKRLLAFDALERSLKAAAELEFEDEAAYAPLTESLWWIAYLSESFRAQDAGYVNAVARSGEGRFINALEYARNRHTHNRNLKSMHWPDQGFGNERGRWRWRNLADIQRDERKDRQGKADYKELLQGRDVFEAYEKAQAFLLAWYDSLDYKGDD